MWLNLTEFQKFDGYTVYTIIGSMQTITTQPTVTIYLAKLHSAMLWWVKHQTLHNHMLAIEPELISRCWQD